MEDFFCAKCNRLISITETANVFRTAWIRIGNVDYPMGLCEDHKVTLPDFPPLETSDTA